MITFHCIQRPWITGVPVRREARPIPDVVVLELSQPPILVASEEPKYHCSNSIARSLIALLPFLTLLASACFPIAIPLQTIC